MSGDIDLAELKQQIWQSLARATADRHHPWRTPVLATVDAAGLPQARTVVLRRAAASDETLEVFTDARSRKVGELAHQPCAVLVFWHPGHRWQLRAQTQAQVLAEGEALNAAWAQVSHSPSAGDYLSALPPGSPLATGFEHQSASSLGEAPRSGADHHLAVLRLRVLALDWLHLARDGHQRAVWRGDRGGMWVQA